MVTITPNVATTLFELFIFISASSTITYRFSRRISLKENDADVPSEEEIESIKLAKKLDGVAIDQEKFDNRIRITRTFLVLLATAALALSLAEAAFIAIQNDGSRWNDAFEIHGPAIAGALQWTVALYTAFSAMAGSHLWFSIVIYTIITLTATISDLSLLIIPQSEGKVQLDFLIARFCISVIAVIIVTTTPDGPRRQATTSDGSIKLARLGGKGRSIISMFWFTQAVKLIEIARKRGQVDEDDCNSPGSHLSARLMASQFSRIYTRSKKVANPEKVPTATLRSCWPLLRTIFMANKGLIITNQMLSCTNAVLFYLPYYTTFQIIRYLEDQEKDGKSPTGWERLRFGLPYCLLFAVSILGQSLMMGQLVTIYGQWLRSRIRIQLNTAIFAKSLRRKDVSGDGAEMEKADDESEDSDDEEVDSEKTSFTSKTQVVNLASVDSERCSQVHYLISFSMAPVELVVGSIFIIKLLGWGAVVGLLSSIALQPVILFLGKLLAKYEGLQQATRDRKVTLLNELFQAIRMVKFNAWERQSSEKVKLVRDEELKYQKILFIIEGIQSIVFVFSPILVVLVAYGWFTLVDKKPLSPAIAFTAMSVLDEMRYSLTNIPEGLTYFIQALVSVGRIQKYLDSEEVDEPVLSQSREVYVREATIEWPRSKSEDGQTTPVESLFSLQKISINFVPNGFNLIVGKIGSGKTLLLKALLGEADLIEGELACPNSLPTSIGQPCPLSEEGWVRKDQVTYVPQTAFLINASIKDNILFGLPMLQSRYEATLDACGLLPDLKLLEDGDETEIGENGIGLSGGQKIRVTLARAAYGRGATVLLDDCLSAVDAHTAETIHQNLLKGPLFSNRTILLVTHQCQLVCQSADQVIMLSDGKVGFQGDPITFMSSALYNGLVEDQEEPEKKPEIEADKSLDTTPATTAPPSPQLASVELVKDATPDPAKVDSDPAKNTNPRKLVEKESRAKGAVLLSIYARYISAAGGTLYAVLLVASIVVANGFDIVTSKWLQYWSSDVITHQRHSNLWWLVGWAGLWGILMVVHVISMLLLYYGSLRASKILYTAMLDAILHAPLRFHDTVSRGRLLNRFGYDFEEMDSEMADVFERMGDKFVSIGVNIIVVASGGGYTFVILFALMIPLYAIVGRLYMIAVRDLKRLASTTRSPILSTFSDVVSGVNVIRAFGASNHFFDKLVERIEVNVKFQYWANELRWFFEIIYSTFSFCLILIGAVVILVNTDVGAARAGFIFSFLTNSNIHILFFLQAYANLEQKLVSVERIVEYTQLDQEGESAKVKSIPAAWPSSGSVEIKDLKVRYAKELPDVLKGVTVSIPAGAKVGVVGPTGCGKSTLASSFFRFVEVTSGSISIDGFDISTIPLKDLRSRLQIVPQDPIILSGPLRGSVDVLNEFSDEEVRGALRDVQLLKEGMIDGDATPSKSGMYDLQYNISEGGSNLSNGEKQLLCLARAILKRSKLIVFDEATSSVDFDTDQVISQTIRRAFDQSTILTIAHRLRTIVDYDLVIVMDDGQITEFDSPKELLLDSNSRFYKLCRASGRRELAHLKAMAGI